MATLRDVLGRSRGDRFLPALLATLLAATVFSTAACGDDASSSNAPDASERDGAPGNDAMQPVADASTPADADPDKSDAGGGNGEVCGGFSGAPCGPRFFCDYGAGDECGIADATGTCMPRPDACPPVFMPVCGCDGQTYNTACDAYQAGTDVAADNPC